MLRWVPCPPTASRSESSRTPSWISETQNESSSDGEWEKEKFSRLCFALMMNSSLRFLFALLLFESCSSTLLPLFSLPSLSLSSFQFLSEAHEKLVSFSPTYFLFSACFFSEPLSFIRPLCCVRRGILTKWVTEGSLNVSLVVREKLELTQALNHPQISSSELFQGLFPLCFPSFFSSESTLDSPS